MHIKSSYRNESTNGIMVELADGTSQPASALYELEISIGASGILLRLADTHAEEEIAAIETELIEAGGPGISFCGTHSNHENWRPFVGSDLTLGIQGDSLRLCNSRIATLTGLINVLGQNLCAYFDQRKISATICRHGEFGLAVHIAGTRRSTKPQVTLHAPGSPGKASTTGNAPIPISATTAQQMLNNIQQKATQALGVNSTPKPTSAPPAPSQAGQAKPTVRATPQPRRNRPHAGLKNWF